MANDRNDQTAVGTQDADRRVAVTRGPERQAVGRNGWVFCTEELHVICQHQKGRSKHDVYPCGDLVQCEGQPGLISCLFFAQFHHHFGTDIEGRRLITDAGPRDATDPLSATGLDAASLQRLAADKDVAVGVFHLQTPAGRDNHAYAEGEYRLLSTVPGVGEFYYPVRAGDVDRFESALSALTDVLTAHVRAAAAGQPPALARESAGEPDLAAFQTTVDRLGYGLRMRYLQERAGEGVPSLFNAWMIDRDFDTPEERALDVRVLLTRDQLSDLHEVLRQVLMTAEEGTLAPDDFLDELKSLAASVSRDPQAARTATRTVGGESLADLGYMREYLEGLPYKSEVMYLDLSIWEQWPAQRQFEFVNQLDSKVAYYRALHDNIDLWVSLDGEAVDGARAADRYRPANATSTRATSSRPS